VLKGEELHRMIFFHGGDDTGFVPIRATHKRPTRRK
jgi:hypothetical protein